MSINFEHNHNPADSGISTIFKDRSKLPMLVGIVLVTAVLMFLFFSADSGTGVRNQAFSSGQAITVENPNGGLSHMTAGPGMMSASVSEEDREQSICTVQPGTHGVIEEQQVIDLLSYVRVKLTDGDCEGKSGWITITNVKGSA